MVFAAVEIDYEQMFEWAPISLWLEDYSEIKVLLDALRAQGVADPAARLRHDPALLAQCSQRLRVIRVNRQTLQVHGAQTQEELLQRLPEIFRDEMLLNLIDELASLSQGQLHFTKETVNYALDGRRLQAEIHVRVLPGHEASWSRVLVSLLDITARKAIAADLEYASRHDSLTNLYNRAFYTAELGRIAERGPWPLAVVCMDLNGLKRLNDDHGHAAGDAMLRRVGAMLREACTDPRWSMTRTGGDEFVALMPGGDERDACALIERIEASVAAFNQTGPAFGVSVSFGMASCRAADQLDEALHTADQRMFAAKALFYRDGLMERRTARDHEVEKGPS